MYQYRYRYTCTALLCIGMCPFIKYIDTLLEIMKVICRVYNESIGIEKHEKLKSFCASARTAIRPGIPTKKMGANNQQFAWIECGGLER